MTEPFNILKFLAMGSFLGLTAGLSPGPLLALVISETLKHNRKEGIKIAISPLVTDVPIVIASFFLFSRLSQFESVLGVISILGAIFIGHLGYETINAKEISIGDTGRPANTLRKGILANFLSPHPYLFWLTVGAPLAAKALEINIFTLFLYFTSFYICLIGSKIGVAHIVARSKVIFSNMLYLWIMRFLGIALFIFSALFFFEGLKYFGAIKT